LNADLGGDSSLTVANSTLSGNTTYYNGYNYGRGAAAANFGGLLTFSNSVITLNTAYDGGGVANLYGTMEITDSILRGNTADDDGGAAFVEGGNLVIDGSTISGNEAGDDGGGLYSYEGNIELVNSTISHNTAAYGGGLVAAYNSTVTLTNTTVTGNEASVHGGGVDAYDGTIILNRSLITGNSAPAGREGYSHGGGTVTAGNYNLFGYNNDAGVSGFAAGASDVVPGAGVQIADILETTAADNGGPQAGVTGSTEPILTHALVSPTSPAIDAAPNAGCTAAPVSGEDQRDEPRNTDGDGSASTNECDIGAFEAPGATPPSDAILYLTAAGKAKTADGVPFGKDDILHWDGSHWSLFFDGTQHGVSSKPDINAIHVNAANDLYLSYFPNTVNNIPGVGQITGHDILHFDGSNFTLFFDGSDVGLTTINEKVDALHILPGSVSLPGGGSCDHYLLLSLLGKGQVPAGGGTLNFFGEDLLGFCASSTGETTAGTWHMVLDGSAEGMPKNSTDSISANADGSVIYLTTKSTFNVDAASGTHSMVYKLEGGSFSGPFFTASANGLTQKVDGLHVEGDLP
jgi:hypothetical protein